MDKKTLLIIGAGYGQLPAIHTAKKMGLIVIVVDKNPDAIGMKYADIACVVDVVDKEGVLAVAKKYNVNGVVTMQSDLPVPTIGFINDSLNLSGVSFDVANFCSNKIETRKLLKKKNAAQPQFEFVESLNEAMSAVGNIGFPCIIKAPDSSGSRGVTKVNILEDVNAAYQEALKWSRGRTIIVEEFIEGLEFGAQTFSINGKCECVLLHNDTMSNPPFMIPIGHSFPFVHLNETDSAIAINDIKNAVDALGIQDGPANVDLILDKRNNRIKVIEIGARIGATCLPELVWHYSGIDWVEQTILSSLGEKVDLTVQKKQPVAALIIESPKDGKFINYKFPFEEINEIKEFEITVSEGEDVSQLRKGTDRIGKILVYGKDPIHAEERASFYREKVEIFVQ
ncbi:MAG: ATP-grasp domain-containing protein [Sphingobacterium sp.]